MNGKKFLNSTGQWFKKHSKQLSGVFLVVFGIILMLFASRIVFDMVFLAGGAALIYFGLHLLHIKAVTDVIDEKFVNKFIYNRRK